MPGFTCCVPGCYNNSHRDKELHFYTFPKDESQRSLWLKNISRAGVSGCFSTFQPTTGHRVCSVHFPGGKKTYSIRVPTIFPLRGVNERRGRRFKRKLLHATANNNSGGGGNTNNENANANQQQQQQESKEASKRGSGAGKEEAKPIDLTVQVEGSETGAAATAAASTSALTAAAVAVVRSEVYISETYDHSYSLSSRTTSEELLRKLNEQRDIIALMEVKMKEMKATVRQLRITEAKLREEIREKDRLLSMGVIRKKYGM
uniref:THAP domain-containing protein 11 n=1 Tax=Latimeria chalumnae TaxID=7897 RepID=H3B9M6_LATCH|nr:PREDICTED: THAP domain-containing protein 11 [Latimeria chalumnae]|eukprot:XP_005992852.1 PREDICTED: THAP domain-containing protein 11 [Latimeria chalumnae]